MQKFEVLIEENAFGAVRPVEVGVDAPMSELVPFLIETLDLPQTDLFGKQLVYMVRLAANGRILPEHMTLRDAGVRPGARLALDSYVMDGSVETLAQQQQVQHAQQHQYSTQPPAHLYSSVTLADHNSLPVPTPSQPLISPPDPLPLVPQQIPRSKNMTRRIFLSVGGSVAAMAAIGFGYEAYAKYLQVGNAPRHSLPVTHKTGGPNPQPKTTPSPVAQPNAKPTNQASPTTTPAQAMTALQSQLQFTGHQQVVRTIAWSSNGTFLASAGDDGHIMTWNTQGAVLQNLQAPAAVRSLALSGDGQRVMAGAGTQILFFSLQTGKVLAQSAHRHTQAVTAVAWSAQKKQRAISVSTDKQAIVWDTMNYQPRLTYTRHTLGLDAVAVAFDGQTVATSSDGGLIRIWNMENGQDLHGYYQDIQTPIRAVAFSGTGVLAAGCDDGKVRLWNNGLTCTLNNARCADMPQRFMAAQKAILTLAWSPNGMLLASGADDGTLTIWSPFHNQQPLITMQLNASIQSLTWSPDGKLLATASSNVVTVWMLKQ